MMGSLALMHLLFTLKSKQTNKQTRIQHENLFGRGEKKSYSSACVAWQSVVFLYNNVGELAVAQKLAQSIVSY